MACKLPLKNSPSEGEGEKCWPRNQSSSHFISSNCSVKPGETENSRKRGFRRSNYGQRRDQCVTGIPGIDRSSDRVPVDDELDDGYDSDDLSEGVVSPVWKGLENETDDQLIVWPPMVILKNTRSQEDEKGKWVGVGSSELRSCFKHYDIRRVHNAYGPSGHCGTSLLIFDSSLNGYFEAERLHKQFLKENRGKCASENYRGKKHSLGEFLLCGYMVTEDEMELFNKNSKGKQKQKYEIKSYKLMIVDASKTLKEKLISLETKVSSGMEENKVLTETCDVINRKLQLRGNDIEKLKKMATHQWEESETEMDYMEKYYGDIINKLCKDLEESEIERKKLGDINNKLRKNLEESEIERKKLLKPFHSSGCNGPDSVVEDYNH